MTLAMVPEDRRCNAKTRAGTPCKNWGIRPSGRCRMHDGWYSRYFPYTVYRAEIEYRARLNAMIEKRLPHAPEGTP